MVPLLGPCDPLPPAEAARTDLGGLLAVGGGLSPERLLDAYRRGAFPWGTIEGLPVWYNPDPRMVLFPAELRVSRSLRRTLRRGEYEVRLDTDFSGVIAACAESPRRGQSGTWITTEMRAAYIRLHELGWAHSVEIYQEGDLSGGLYGMAIGGMFYGESMFSRRTDASKIAFAHLVRFLRQRRFGLIDCQMHTDHLASLGAREIARGAFLAQVNELIDIPSPPGKWARDAARFDWSTPWPC